MYESARRNLGPIVKPRRGLTAADLPSPKIQRWNIRRKALVVAALHAGLLSPEEALSRYALSPEELLSWERDIEHGGAIGLRPTGRPFAPAKSRRTRDPSRRRPATVLEVHNV